MTQQIKLSKMTASLGFLCILILAMLSSPWLASEAVDAYNMMLITMHQAPSLAHPLGTDGYGRDVLYQLLIAGRLSLLIAGASAILSVGFGLFWGAISGYSHGTIARTLKQLLDYCTTFPALFVAMTIVAMWGPSMLRLLVLLALLSWVDTAHLAHAEMKRLRQQGYVQAVRGYGLSHWRLFFWHMLPDILPQMLVTIPSRVAAILLLESALSFLGFGVQAPALSWGTMILDGTQVMGYAWWVGIFPALALCWTVYALLVLGDAVRLRYGIDKSSAMSYDSSLQVSRR